ncbi:MarR family transcriptional regulator, partial [Bacillus cereus]
MDTLGQAKEELLEAGYDLISPAQKEARKKYKPIARDGRHFAMQNIEGYELLRSQLTQGQKGVLLLLTTAMEINEGGKLFKGKNERLTVEDVSVMIGKKRVQTFKILTELENIGAITKEQVGKN